MLARVQLTLAAALALVAVGLGLYFVFGPDGEVRPADANEGLTVGPDGYVGAIAPPGIRPRDFTLPDENGNAVSLAKLRGQVVMVTFMYSTCQDTCPTTAQAIRLALNDVGDDAKGLPVLAVSVDPAQDTELRTKRFLIKQSLYGRMRFLRGTAAQLAPVWTAYGVDAQEDGSKKQDDHTISVLLIGRDGKQRVRLPVDGLTPEALAHDLRKVLADM